MELKVGNRVEVESESPERRPRMGVIEEVVRQGHLRLAIAFAGTTVESTDTPAAGALHRARASKKA